MICPNQEIPAVSSLSHECHACEDARLAVVEQEQGEWAALMGRRFLVCPACGNKRCPKAQHHDRVCTNSNATGQPGGG